MFLMLMVIISVSNDLFSQSSKVKPTRQSSFEAYSTGNYEQAYLEFNELLQTYSKDPLYKYYSGVCLVKLNKKPDEASTLLKEALQSAAVVKTLPSDALFYLGRAQQMSGKFADASGTFNLFTEQVGKRAARDLGVPDYIQQCSENKGEVAEPEIRQVEKAASDKVAIVKTEDKIVAKDVIQPIVKKETAVKENLPPAYNKILDEAAGFQFRSDSVRNIIVGQKEELGRLSNEEKPALKVKISENELLASSFQKEADQRYDEARIATSPVQKQAPQKEVLQLPESVTIKDSVKQSDKLIFIKSIKEPDNIAVKEITVQSDTLKKNMPVVNNPIETFAFFEVLPKPISGVNEKIMIDPEVPPGLIYRIQVAVFRNPVSPSYFMGITPVYGFRIEGTDKTNYYAGMFRRSAEAKKALLAVKAKGFKDSFIVALADSKIVSSDRAAVMEKEWGKKPFVTLANSVNETPLDTVPPTLSFRVEVTRSLIPLKDDIISGIEKMAGSRGLDIQIFDDGNIVYMIGKFITFESAEEYADLLIRNGYREAHVVARLGKKEIPVETAKQLFDDMK